MVSWEDVNENGRRVRERDMDGFGDQEKGSRAKEGGQPLPEKAKKWIFPMIPQERKQPCRHFDFSPVRPILNF